MTQRKPKIVHFYQDNYNYGGIQMYLDNTLPRLAERGHYEIVFVGTKNSRLTTNLSEKGIKTHGIYFPLKKRSLLKSFLTKPMPRTLDVRVYFELLKILEMEQPDFVHIHGGRVEASVIKTKGGFPLFYTYHGYGHLFNLEMAPTWLHRKYYECVRPLFQKLVPHLDAMTVVSNFERDRLYREEFISSTFEPTVLYNGIPFDKFQADIAGLTKADIRARLGIPQDARVISFISRLNRNKNADGFLAIAQRLVNDPARTAPVYFLVAGDGIMSDAFRQIFAEGGALAGYGQYLGFRSDVPQLTFAGDMTLSTALQEGFGLRVLESLAVGTPCLAYAAGGIPEVMAFEDNEDWLVPVGDEEALYAKLFHHVHAQADFDSLAEKLKAHAGAFDINRQLDRLESCYADLLMKLSYRQPTSLPAEMNMTAIKQRELHHGACAR